MTAVDDLDQVIEQCQQAANEFLKGNPKAHKMMFSHREDATLLNPFGSLDHGFEQVAETMERVASQVSDGEVTSFDVVEKYVTPELACVVWVERSKAKAGGRQEVLPFGPQGVMIPKIQDSGKGARFGRRAEPTMTDGPDT